jgi:hypothetical protein
VSPAGICRFQEQAYLYRGVRLFCVGHGLMPPKGAILLSEVAKHLAAVEISCNFCPRRGKASVARLMHEHGGDMPIPDLPRLLSADCPLALK